MWIPVPEGWDRPVPASTARPLTKVLYTVGDLFSSTEYTSKSTVHCPRSTIYIFDRPPAPASTRVCCRI
jgi:hypothetical protein